MQGRFSARSVTTGTRAGSCGCAQEGPEGWGLGVKEQGRGGRVGPPLRGREVQREVTHWGCGGYARWGYTRPKRLAGLRALPLVMP